MFSAVLKISILKEA